MADLISATSLLTAILAGLYSMWYPDLRIALATKVERKRADRNEAIRDVMATLRTRSVPLLIATTTLCSVLAPDCISILTATVQGIASAMAGHASTYDSLEAVFVVAYGFLVGIAVLAWSHTVGLLRLLRRLRGPDL